MIGSAFTVTPFYSHSHEQHMDISNNRSTHGNMQDANNVHCRDCTTGRRSAQSAGGSTR